MCMVLNMLKLKVGKFLAELQYIKDMYFSKNGGVLIDGSFREMFSLLYVTILFNYHYTY